MLCKLEVCSEKRLLRYGVAYRVKVSCHGLIYKLKNSQKQNINRAGPYSFEVDRSNGFHIGRNSNRWMDRPACPITKYPLLAGYKNIKLCLKQNLKTAAVECVENENM